MAKKSQNQSTNASRRSSRLVERKELEEAPTQLPPSIEEANHGLLIQLAQQVQNLAAVVQNLQQPVGPQPSAEEPTPLSRRSRRS